MSEKFEKEKPVVDHGNNHAWAGVARDIWAPRSESKTSHPSATHQKDDNAGKSAEPSAKSAGSEKHPTTDLNGNVCKVQPKEDEQSTLSSGKKPKGCDFKTVDPESPAGKIAAQAHDSTVHLQVNMGKGEAAGSGVMMSKVGDKCLIATANHVVGGMQGDHVDGITAHINGKSYPAQKEKMDSQTEADDKKSDRAVVSFKIPPGDNVCRPAAFAEKTSATGDVVAYGFPEGSNALTASPGKAEGLTHLDSVMGRDPNIKTTDDPHRVALQTSTNTLEGQSGGPIFDKQGKVGSLVGGGAPGVYNLTFGNPVSSADVTRWTGEVASKDKQR